MAPASPCRGLNEIVNVTEACGIDDTYRRMHCASFLFSGQGHVHYRPMPFMLSEICTRVGCRGS